MNTFKSNREIAATPAEVFAAMQDPVRFARWWGPDGFSNEFETFEFVPGGKWVFTMIGPDGKRYPNESVFSDIATDKRVVIEHVCQPHFVLTITLTPSATGTGTLLAWEQVFADAAVAQAVSHIVAPANEQNIDRLCAELQR